MNRQAGISLTELLVVLAIVGILGALFIPPAWDAFQTVKQLMALVQQTVPLQR